MITQRALVEEYDVRILSDTGRLGGPISLAKQTKQPSKAKSASHQIASQRSCVDALSTCGKSHAKRPGRFCASHWGVVRLRSGSAGFPDVEPRARLRPWLV